ncbi:MAG: hypothetical protein NT155_03805 [Candidatus Staskawiczbacteria bacterium]|nr:hypothetical protein [Candidatus Staskawiczbacteria bacterium]
MKKDNLKKPIYKKIEAQKLRRLYRKDEQLVRVARVARELWNILKEVKETK